MEMLLKADERARLWKVIEAIIFVWERHLEEDHLNWDMHSLRDPTVLSCTFCDLLRQMSSLSMKAVWEKSTTP